MTKLTTAEIGRHLDMSQQSASKLLRDLGANLGTVDLDWVRVQYIQRLRESASLNGKSAEKARLLTLRAEREQIKLERDRRNLIPVDEASEIYGRLVDAAVVRIRGAEARAKDEFPDFAAVHALYRELLDAALEALAQPESGPDGEGLTAP